MKVVILAGGLGTRLSEETIIKPKPMVEVGGMPILWHIMKIYNHYGFNDFIICLGYKGFLIKEYFYNYMMYRSDLIVDSRDGTGITYLNSKNESWKITLIDTGLNSQTGGRLKQVSNYIDDDTFMLTYGDGLADININDLLNFHKKNKCEITVTAVRPNARFGALDIDKNNYVNKFIEKPLGDQGWVNGGFFVMEKTFINKIKDNLTILEREPLEEASRLKELKAFKHLSNWCAMDTLRDKHYLEDLWNENRAFWKVW